jgi:hypothetical protein
MIGVEVWPTSRPCSNAERVSIKHAEYMMEVEQPDWISAPIAVWIKRVIARAEAR